MPATLIKPTTPGDLEESFRDFIAASEALDRNYRRLSRRAARVERDLAAANDRLRGSLAERERLAQALADLLESISCGVMLFDGDGHPCRANREARRLFPGCTLTANGVADGASRELLDEVQAWIARAPGRRRLQLRDGGAGTRRVVDVHLVPRRDERGVLALAYDVSALVRLEEAARRRSRLEAMGRMAAEIAHEIRNPLASMLLTISALRDSLADRPDLREMADQILLGTEILGATVTNMLSSTRAMEPHCIRLDLVALARESAAFAAPLFDSRRVDLRLDLPGAAEANADPDLLRQLVLNLLRNAAEAAGSGGSAALWIRSEAGNLVLGVEDDGPGIPPERRNAVFEPFATTKSGGTGLGLAIVRRVVDAHGWRLDLTDRAGVGTVFRVSLAPYRMPAGSGR